MSGVESLWRVLGVSAAALLAATLLIEFTTAPSAAAGDGFPPAFEPIGASWVPQAPVNPTKDYSHFTVKDVQGDLTGGSGVGSMEARPLPTNPNNVDGFHCDSYDDDRCVGRETHFRVHLPTCTSETEWNCTRGLEVTWQGKTFPATFSHYLDLKGPVDPRTLGLKPHGTEVLSAHPYTDIRGDKQRDLPPGTTVALWEVEGITSVSARTFFAVDVGIDGTRGVGGSVSIGTFHATVVPVIAVARPQQYAPVRVFVRDWDGHFGVGGTGPANAAECAYADMHDCFLRARVPRDLRLTLDLNVTSSVNGWLHGRIEDPSIRVSQIDARTDRLTVEGAFVDVPVTSKYLANDELPPGTAISRPDWYRAPGPWMAGTIISPNGRPFFDWFERLLPFLDERAGEVFTHWGVRTISDWELSPCLRSDSELVGLVTTNAMMYNGGPPEFQDGRLTYRVGGVHFAPDGSTQRGTYDLVMRSTAARCLYGYSNAPVSAEISVVSEDGTEQVATTSVSESDGWLRLAARNFTFSTPSISVQLKQESHKIAVTCKRRGKVKTFMRLTDTCPVGWRKA